MIGGLTPIQIDRQIDENFKNSYEIIQKPHFAFHSFRF